MTAPATRFERASRPESAQGFVPVAKRWVVERSIAWTNFFRRIVKDYEYTLSSSVGWLLLANIQLMLQGSSINPKLNSPTRSKTPDSDTKFAFIVTCYATNEKQYLERYQRYLDFI